MDADVQKISLIVDVPCVDWIMRWIDYMPRELHLSIYSALFLYN
jgi:hypothetical protein